MSNGENFFSDFFDIFNLNDKNKSINEIALEYKSKKKTFTDFSPSLNQGEKFKKNQKKIKKNLEKRINYVNSKEGFQGISQLKDQMDLDKNGLTNKSFDIIEKNNKITSNKETIDNLKLQYQNTLNEYTNLISQIQGTTTGYLDRVNPNNPYLNKTIRFTTGHIAYVTNQGMVKYIPSMEIWNSTKAPQQYIQLDIAWDDAWNNNVGAEIPTKPPLVAGTFMEYGQSLGNEGSNVFVNNLVDEPVNSYVGCYNNVPPSTEIKYNPIMTSTNTANGFVAYASTVYLGDNNFTGPWNAFDNNVNTWWHSTDVSVYDVNTGQFIGTGYDQWHSSFINSNGETVEIKAEYLQLNHNELKPIALTRYEIQGRQGCCGDPNGRDPNTWYILGWDTEISQWREVDYQANVSFNWSLKSFTVKDPKPYGAYAIFVTVVGDDKAPPGTRNCVQIATWNLYTSSNFVSNPTPAMTNIGSMSFEQCQSNALITGNQFFGLQGVDNYGNGNCMVSNDLAGSQRYGEGVVYTNTVLWHTNTGSGQSSDTGSMATMTVTGALSVLNSSGQAIFNTDNSSAQPSNYLGCYADQSERAMALYNNGSQEYNLQECEDIAKQQNVAFFGLQNSTSGTNAQCVTGNSWSDTFKYGKAGNCTQLSDGTWSGGGWSNAVYSTSPQSNYFVFLQDDGNMCICRGTSPSDIQGVIWCSMTNGKQQQPNPNFTAQKSKYGGNWMGGTGTLAPGEFVGSTDGSIFLIMQNDGNLVLYTSSNTYGCASSSAAKDKNVGRDDMNALYQFASIGDKSKMGNVAFIDSNSKLYSYPSTNVKFTNNYTELLGKNSWGNDIPGAVYGNATVDSCRETCNNNEECAGFAFSNNVCYPKTSDMFPNGSINADYYVDLYVRGKKPSVPPIGVTNDINNVDTIKYQSYIDGGEMASEYGLGNATASQKQQLEQLQSQMNLLADQIAQLNGNLSDISQEAGLQSQENIKGINDYLQKIKKTQKKIDTFDGNFQNILNDSDIVVLQQNYNYLFWTILAAGAVLITMNISKQK